MKLLDRYRHFHRDPLRQDVYVVRCDCGEEFTVAGPPLESEHYPPAVCPKCMVYGNLAKMEVAITVPPVKSKEKT